MYCFLKHLILPGRNMFFYFSFQDSLEHRILLGGTILFLFRTLHFARKKQFSEEHYKCFGFKTPHSARKSCFWISTRIHQFSKTSTALKHLVFITPLWAAFDKRPLSKLVLSTRSFTCENMTASTVASIGQVKTHLFFRKKKNTAEKKPRF